MHNDPVIVRHGQSSRSLAGRPEAINDAIILHNFNRNLYPVPQ